MLDADLISRALEMSFLGDRHKTAKATKLDVSPVCP